MCIMKDEWPNNQNNKHIWQNTLVQFKIDNKCSQFTHENARDEIFVPLEKRVHAPLLNCNSYGHQWGQMQLNQVCHTFQYSHQSCVASTYIKQINIKYGWGNGEFYADFKNRKENKKKRMVSNYRMGRRG